MGLLLCFRHTHLKATSASPPTNHIPHITGPSGSMRIRLKYRLHRCCAGNRRTLGNVDVSRRSLRQPRWRIYPRHKADHPRYNVCPVSLKNVVRHAFRAQTPTRVCELSNGYNISETLGAISSRRLRNRDNLAFYVAVVVHKDSSLSN